MEKKAINKEMERIKNVIDRYFEFIVEIEENSEIYDSIPESMIDKSKEPKYEGILHWNAIDSTIKESEILELEKLFGHPIPESYKSFLKYRHFIDLELGAHSIAFFKNLPGTFIQDTKEEIKDYYLNLILRNYLPFARQGEFGILCFDASTITVENDYPIVSFKKEDGYMEHGKYTINFESMFIEFEAYLVPWMKIKREIIKMSKESN